VFATIADTRNNKGRPQSPSAMNHLRTTLRAALNLAVKEGVPDCKPAQHIEITGYQQPHAKVWTEARVESWEQTGFTRWWRSGPPTSWPSSSARSTTIRCSRCGGWPASAGCAAVSCAATGGATSTSTTAC
jgi:hypothetical protein